MKQDQGKVLGRDLGEGFFQVGFLREDHVTQVGHESVELVGIGEDTRGKGEGEGEKALRVRGLWKGGGWGNVEGGVEALSIEELHDPGIRVH